MGAGVDEIAFTRGATEAMQVLISGYHRLKPGDGVLYGDLDYLAKSGINAAADVGMLEEM